jgi:hypothetical protein
MRTVLGLVFLTIGSTINLVACNISANGQPNKTSKHTTQAATPGGGGDVISESNSVETGKTSISVCSGAGSNCSVTHLLDPVVGSWYRHCAQHDTNWSMTCKVQTYTGAGSSCPSLSTMNSSGSEQTGIGSSMTYSPSSLSPGSRLFRDREGGFITTKLFPEPRGSSAGSTATTSSKVAWKKT